MKYKKPLSALAATILAIASFQSAFASSMTSWSSGMSNGYGATSTDANEMTNTSIDADDSDATDNDDLTNSDLYRIDSPTVHQGKLVLTNVDEIDISDVLYVYGDMEVTNADTFKVTGKLRVTGKLIVSNGDINVSGGKIYFGKKSFANASITGKQRKVPASLIKFDPILRTDISDEEYAELLKTANDAAKEYAALVKELVVVRKQKGNTAGVADKIIQNRTDFYNEVEQYVQEEDMALFTKLEKADMAATNKKIKVTLGTATR